MRGHRRSVLVGFGGCSIKTRPSRDRYLDKAILQILSTGAHIQGFSNEATNGNLST